MKTIFTPKKRTQPKPQTYVLRINEEPYKVMGYIAERTGQSLTKVASALIESALMDAEIDMDCGGDLLAAYKAKHKTESAEDGCGK